MYYLKLTLLLFFLINNLFSQVSFPLLEQTSDDFSSSYGPRYYGTDNYDFHAAIDIAAPHFSEVYAVANGVVDKIKDDANNPNNRYVLIKHTDIDGDFFVLYMHIDPDPFLSKGSNVDEYTRLGWVNYPDHDHLDIRYSEESVFHFGTFDNSLNPGRMLYGTNFPPAPQAVYRNGTEYGELIDGFYEFPIQQDDLGHYIEIGARTQDDELDIDEISLVMSYWDGVNAYYTEDLLNTSAIKMGHEYNSVKYEARNNCGDLDVANDDKGHWSSSVGIYPTDFNSWENYHVVYFRWYFDESVFNSLNGNIDIDVDIWDWDLNNAYVNDIAVVTCVDCNPPSGVPNPPNLISTNYEQNTDAIKIEWDPTSGPESNYFQIYRCLSSRTMTNKDKIAISSTSENHFFYIDDDTTLIHGQSYKYAVAGVNSVGEGLNSNELIAYYGTLPMAVEILGPTYLASGNQGSFTAEASYGSGTYTDYRWWERNDAGVFAPRANPGDGPTINAPQTGTWNEITSARGQKTIQRGHPWSFSLKCEVTDSQGATATDEHSVTVSGGNTPAAVSDRFSVDSEPVVPNELTLDANYPNPFNPSTTIKFGLPADRPVKLSIYSSTGQLITTLVNGYLSKGYHSIKWNGKNGKGVNVSTGIYVYELKAGNKRLLRKMLFSK